MKWTLAAIVGLMGLTSVVHAETPVAVVEDVQGKVTGAEFMDYVVPGTVIKLGSDGKVVLGYLKSCRRETVTGLGTLIVGAEQSAVHLADLNAIQVPCDSNQSQVVPQQVNESAATIVRSINEPSATVPSLTIHGVSPIIEATGPGKLVIERLDVPGERHELAPAAMTRGRFYDLARTKLSLVAGGIYSARIGSRLLVFRIDAAADAGAGPIIGRLIRLR